MPFFLNALSENQNIFFRWPKQNFFFLNIFAYVYTGKDSDSAWPKMEAKTLGYTLKIGLVKISFRHIAKEILYHTIQSIIINDK